MSETGSIVTTNNRAKVRVAIEVILVIVTLMIWAFTWLVTTPEESSVTPAAELTPSTCQESPAEPTPVEFPRTGVSL